MKSWTGECGVEWLRQALMHVLRFPVALELLAKPPSSASANEWHYTLPIGESARSDLKECIHNF